MPDLRTRLIEAAIRPFSDNAELKLSASDLLGGLQIHDEGAEEAIKLWETLDARKRKPTWRIVLFSVLVMVSAAVLIDGARIISRYESPFGFGSPPFADVFYGSPRITDEQVARQLDSSQALLLFGDLSKSSPSDRMKALWNSEPGNPAYFAEYANAYFSEHEDLPPDFLRTARRIDPQNAWFTYVAAGVRAKGAVKQRPQSKTDKAAKETPEWDVLDAAKFHDSLALLREARGQSQCESYAIQLHRQRMKLLPLRTPAETIYAIGSIYGNGDFCETSLREVGRVIAAKAWLTGEANDSDAFRELLIDADGFLWKRAGAEVGSVLPELITTVGAFTMVHNLKPVAEKFGIDNEAGRLRAISDRVHKRERLRETRKSIVSRDLLRAHGSDLAANLIAPVYTQNLQHPPLLSLDEIKPGRLMDHEALSWTNSYFMWASLIGMTGIVAAYRFRLPVLIRRLAGRLESLMRPADWLLVLGFGIFMPIAWFATINRFTPLGGRGVSVSYGMSDPPLLLVQILGLAVLLILFPGIIARWRMRRRMKVFGFMSKRLALDFLAAACAAAFIPVYGSAVVNSSTAATIVAWGLAAISLLLLILISTKALLGPPTNLLRCGIIARILLPAYAFAALIVISATPLFKFAAFHWFEKDQLVRPDPDYPVASRFEHKAAVQMRKELRETLGYDP